jgi:translation elongation factor EF-1beta
LAVIMRKKISRLRESEMSVWPNTRRRRKERPSQLPSPLSLWMSSLGVCILLVVNSIAVLTSLSDDETDMKLLEGSVRGIEKDGLVWGASKLVAVGFGIKKLQINLVIEDDKIGLSDLQEEIEEFEDYVQSSDIVSPTCSPHLSSATDNYVVCYAKVVELLGFWFFPTCIICHASLDTAFLLVISWFSMRQIIGVES